MQSEIFLPFYLLCAIGICTAYVVLPDSQIIRKDKQLLGAKECTWGPSYWCSNLTAAAGCKAVPHCIQTVWLHQKIPHDNDTICQICEDMVKQARDQLLSNQTEEEIKEVFEGSCKLIHLKPAVEICVKLADEYMVALVDTLSSMMDPQRVCTAARLCNNANIDLLLEEQSKVTGGKGSALVAQSVPIKCEDCHTFVDVLEKRFNGASVNNVLQGFLEACGQLGSFSDSCSNIILNYFPEIYDHLKKNLNANQVCLLAGSCTEVFHVHADVSPLSSSGVIPINKDGEVADGEICALCEQFVQSARDIVISNTSEVEFTKMMKGICKTLGSFSKECSAAVDQYGPEIYNFISKTLDPKKTCSLMKLCGVNSLSANQDSTPLVPLLLRTPDAEQAAKLKKLLKDDAKPTLHRVALGKSDSTVRISESTRLTNSEAMQQLPIERLAPKTLTLMGNTELCTFCEYFLHYVQQAITEPATEEEMKDVVYKVCNVLPKTLNGTCHDFVSTYGDAMVAILAQKIDPSQACPMLSLCPSAGDHDVEVFIKHYGGVHDKPNCPLCLFAVEELEGLVKNNKTKENVKEALSKLCSHLSKNLAMECDDFVNTYTDELVEMLVSNFNPQEVCVYLKLCNDTKLEEKWDDQIPIVYGGKVSTNEIPDKTANGKTLITAELIDSAKSPVSEKPQCILCEFIMSQIENELEDNKTDEAIKSAVLNVCKHLPKTIKKDCTNFVNQHADQVIQLLIATMDPHKVCGMMGLCGPALKDLHLEVQGCTVCELVVTALDQLLQNPNIDHKIEHLFKKACRGIPGEYKAQCETLISTYGDAIFDELTHLSDPSTICSTIGVCGSQHHLHHRRDATPIMGSNKCTMGPGYWCKNLANAIECQVIDFCMEKVWKGGAPSA